MAKMSVRRGEWVVVCDGAKALLFENIGDAELVNLKTREVYEHKDLATHELGTDAPGRSMNSVGSARSAVGQADWHDRAETSFLEDLAKRLDTAVNAGQVKSLIVVAPPRALGVLRAAYSPALRGVLRAEIDKDLVKMPVPEIERHLAA